MNGINRAYFDGLMRDKEISLRSLAKRIGLNHSQLSLTFSGARKMQLDEAAALASFFGQPIETIIENMGVPLLIRGRACNLVGYMIDDGTVIEAEGKAIAPEECPDGTVAIQARCGSSYMDGWTFFAVSRSDWLGRFCLVTLDDNRRVMAAVRRGYGLGMFNLFGTHEATDRGIKSALPVVMIRN